MRITIGKAKRGLGSLLPGQAYVGRPSALGNPFVGEGWQPPGGDRQIQAVAVGKAAGA
jgi:hypothetical protein